MLEIFIIKTFKIQSFLTISLLFKVTEKEIRKIEAKTQKQGLRKMRTPRITASVAKSMVTASKQDPELPTLLRKQINTTAITWRKKQRQGYCRLREIDRSRSPSMWFKNKYRKQQLWCFARQHIQWWDVSRQGKVSLLLKE